VEHLELVITAHHLTRAEASAGSPVSGVMMPERLHLKGDMQEQQLLPARSCWGLSWSGVHLERAAAQLAACMMNASAGSHPARVGAEDWRSRSQCCCDCSPCLNAGRCASGRRELCEGCCRRGYWNFHCEHKCIILRDYCWEIWMAARDLTDTVNRDYSAMRKRIRVVRCEDV
jgi:hypothetical protein